MNTVITDLAAAGILVNPNGATQQHVRCPSCNKKGRDTALSVNIHSGLYHCFRCDLAGRAGRISATPGRPPIIHIDDPAIAERKRQRLRRTWQEALPLTHPRAHPVRAYLESRALGRVLDKPPTVLRAHPGLAYWDGSNNLGRFPAMVALFSGASGQPVTLHATYLRGDGCAKAGVPDPKKILGVPALGATRGGAIHLHEPFNGRLGIAEGIESALSLHVLQRLPVWAGFCANNIARIHLPHGLRELHIGVDLDESGKGEAVARALAQRVCKWSPQTKVWFVKPRLDAPADLNDQLQHRRTTRTANPATQAVES